MRKFKCLIRLGRGGSMWKIVETHNVVQAKAEFEMLYGKENIKSGVVPTK
jgi:hypothetical protein